MQGLVVQAVIVSVNYGDFLEHTLENNLPHFDHLVVVTDHADRRTAELCRRYSVQCVKTDEFYFEGDPFNKARAINVGLSHLRPGGWRLHLDADIALPTGFRQALRRHPLDERTIYGADRINVYGPEAWQRVRNELPRQYNYHYMVSPVNGPGTAMASRFVHSEWGYCPIGFFQLWHSCHGYRYPVNQGSAEHTDVTFAIQFPRSCRQIIPELFVYHLESQKHATGANWQGRTTGDFNGASDNSAQRVEPTMPNYMR